MSCSSAPPLLADRGGQLMIRRGEPEIVKVKGGYLVDDELVAVSSRHDVRPPGAMRYGPRGRVLSVRDAAEAALAA